jgi:DNA-binding HxlR family transcriptional regulator
VLAEMSVCEPYTVGELEETFEDASRWTIQRRLDALVEDGEISKKKHAENRVSYWIPA